MAQGPTGTADLKTERAVDLGNTGTSLATDLSLGTVFEADATDNFTLANPTNPTAAQKIVWRIKQDATGSRIITYGSKFRAASALSTVLTTAANAVDYIAAIYRAGDDLYEIVSLSKDITTI